MHAVTSFGYLAATGPRTLRLQRRRGRRRQTNVGRSFDYVMSGFVLLVDVHFSYFVAARECHTQRIAVTTHILYTTL